MPAARFTVSGMVQGVFYRASTRDQAAVLGLTGLAKNLANGDVEVWAIGELDALDALEQWLWRGPPMAAVESVVRVCVAEQDLPDDNQSGFGIR